MEALLSVRRVLVIVAAALLITGCTKSYVDPQYQDADFSQLSPPQEAVKVVLDFTFHTNGKENESVTKTVRPWVVNILLGSRVMMPVESDEADASAGRLKIVMDNVGDLGEAAMKGFGTGLTFGLAGSLVTDGYTFTVEYTPAGTETIINKSYKHAIHSTIGNKEGPEGLTPMTTMEAFHAILEDLVIVCLKDLQKDGHLAEAEILRTKFHSLYSEIGTVNVIN